MWPEKSRWLSKGFLGGLMATIASLLALIGVVISPEQQEIIVTAALLVVSTVSSIMSAYGRLKATEKLK